MTTRLSGSLRMFMGVVIVLAVVVAGFLNRSAWLILLATPVFTALYALGKWDSWKRAWRTGGAKAIIIAILMTLPIQLILVGILFLIGLGASMLMGTSSDLQQLTSADVVAAVTLFLVAVGISSFINVLETRAAGDAPRQTIGFDMADDAGDVAGQENRYREDDAELDIDPRPLTPQTFYIARGYWKRDALFDALQGRGEPVVRKREAASEGDILAAEQRLGVRLPDSLRDLYKMMDGGYVGWMYVPLKADPGPFYDDWRGAFSIDYSSLNSLHQLRTVKDHYEDFTDDPDEMPANADKLVMLQARYQDMTLLDYSQGPEARVRVVDFDERPEQSTAVEFPDFDRFFAALRREYPEKVTTGDRLLAYRKKPVADYMPAQQPSEFWRADPHVFANIAASRKDGSEPKKKADDDLVVATQARLGVTLPPVLVDLWRYQNGGVLAARHLQISKSDAPYDECELPEQLMPMEYFATLADVSDRITYPEGETPLRERHPGAERLVVLQAKDGEALLLDYRGNTLEPGVLLVEDLDNKHLASAKRVNSFALLLERVRGWQARS